MCFGAFNPFADVPRLRIILPIVKFLIINYGFFPPSPLVEIDKKGLISETYTGIFNRFGREKQFVVFLLACDVLFSII